MVMNGMMNIAGLPALASPPRSFTDLVRCWLKHRDRNSFI